MKFQLLLKEFLPGAVLIAAAVHVAWAPVIVLYPDAMGATATRHLLGLGAPLAGAVYLAAGVAALRGLSAARLLERFFWVLPQQYLLTVSALSAILAVARGQYADGTVIPAAHIFVDQAPYLALALAHTCGLLLRPL